MILLQPPIYILLELCIILISLIIYKPSTLIISPQIFSMQLGAGISLVCLSQCAIPFCTLSMSIVLLRKEHLQVMEEGIQEGIKKIQTREQEVTKQLEKKNKQS